MTTMLINAAVAATQLTIMRIQIIVTDAMNGIN